MFHYIPASHLPTYPYSSSHLSSPRDRYLAALAEAKAAEAEYLAAETARREEDELRRRLAEIQHRKQEQLLRSRYDLAPYNYLDTYPSYDRLSIHRKQVEEEGRLRLLALREAELEEHRRREQAALELEAVRLRRAREETLRLRQQEQREQAHLRALLQPTLQVAEHDRPCSNQTSTIVCHRPRKQAAPVPQPSLRVLLGPEAKVPAPVGLKRQTKEEGDVFEILLKQILESKASTPPVTTSNPSTLQRESALKSQTAQEPALKPSTVQNKDVLDLQKYFEHLFKSIGLSFDQPQQPPSQTIPSSEAASDESFQSHLKEFAKLLVPPVVERSTSRSQASASSSSSKSVQDVPAKAAQAAPTASTHNVTKTQESDIPMQSLKEQLEARLNNEFSSEVRDTIQAIFESLRDANNHERSTPATSSNKVASSSKGKAKAYESSTTSVPSSNPTSKDIVDSFNEIRSIEAAFHALETDFTFPTTLDFISSHLVHGSPVFSNSENSSAITHLAYTSRNHPVRFYKQALDALVAQLDSIDSSGNDALRVTRKEVVGRVEKALEELEKEIEGRYRTWLAKEARSLPIETTVASEVSMTTNSATFDSDSTPVPEPKVENSEESTSEPDASTVTSVGESSLESESEFSSPQTQTHPGYAEPNPTIANESPPSSSFTTVKDYEVQAEVITSVPASPSIETEFIDVY